MDIAASSKDHHNYEQPPNHLEWSWGHSAEDDAATDDEQDDLPFDGILECYLVPSLTCDLQINSDIPSDYPQESNKSLEEGLPVNISIASATTSDETVYSLDSNSEFSLSETIAKPSEAKEVTQHNSDNLVSIPTIIPDVLLRHFTEDNLLNPYEFIDYETIPEISIAESSDETVLSRKSCTKHSQNGVLNDEDFRMESFKIGKNENTGDREDILINEVNSDTDETLLKENVSEFDQGGKELHELPANNMEKEVQHPKQDQERRLSSSEIKYGQGQVHYKLPDFSKVAPKVKIPKGDTGNVKPVSLIKRATSSSNLSGQYIVIQDILDSMQSFTEHGLMEDSSICSDTLHVQVPQILQNANDSKDQINCVVTTTDFHQRPKITDKQTEDSLTGIQGEDGLQTCKPASTVDRQSQNTEEVQLLTEGERMSRMLMEQVQQLKNKVFQNLRSCLESLEFNYLSSKDKHRNLQLQTYRTGCQTVGEFDFEREVEGQIYRLGMLLEDIQEQINKNDRSLTESLPSIKPDQASVSPNAEGPEDATNMKTSFNERHLLSTQEEEPASLLQCPRSLNITAPNPQIPQQELPLENNGTDHSHLMVNHISGKYESASATDLIQSSVTEMVVTTQKEELMDLLPCSRSLNSTALNIQIPEPPLIKNKTDKSHLLQCYQSSLTSPRISKTTELSPKSMTNSSDQLATRQTYVTSMDHASSVHNLLSSSLFLQSNMSQSQSSADLRCSEIYGKSGNPEKMFQNCYHEADLRTTQPVCQGKLPVIQRKALNVEIPACNAKTDSFRSNWLVTPHSEILKYKHQLPRSNRTYLPKCFTPLVSSSPSWNKYKTGTFSAGNQSTLLNSNILMTDKALHKQKPYGASRYRILGDLQNQVSLKKQPDLSKYDMDRQYMHLSRYSVQSSTSSHSQLAAPVTSNFQRKYWPDVKESPLNYNDLKVLNSVLDQTLRTAKNIQKTTEKMIQRLTADLVNSTFRHSSRID
ncbi:protein AKNAD1 isoform X2 [Rana temporaria]|uniref:protein AKNAD1 isoform X2 n=1 Tax=Rana temporaria TaxID=8407 RepID=UPI001AACC379|nr:protein AKNAD1 isoform X2 [Rana temporaria]